MGDVIREWINAMLNLIYPRNIKCMLCENELFDKEEYSLCKSCFGKLYMLDDSVCICCGRLLGDMSTLSTCSDCVNDSPMYTQNVSVVLYNESSKKLIYQLKYGDARYVAYHVGKQMADKLKSKPEFLATMDFMIPIPISHQRLGERGFNQAALIAGYISERTHLEVESKVVERFIHTPPQTKLNRVERKQNLRGVFRVKEPEIIIGKRILLIDDVITTGSTINEVAKELIKMGAYEVYALTFAAPVTQ